MDTWFQSLIPLYFFSFYYLYWKSTKPRWSLLSCILALDINFISWLNQMWFMNIVIDCVLYQHDSPTTASSCATNFSLWSTLKSCVSHCNLQPKLLPFAHCYYTWRVKPHFAPFSDFSSSPRHICISGHSQHLPVFLVTGVSYYFNHALLVQPKISLSVDPDHIL